MAEFLFAVVLMLAIGMYGAAQSRKRREAELLRAGQAYADFWPAWDRWHTHIPSATVHDFASSFARDRGIVGVVEFHLWIQQSDQYKALPESVRG